MTKFLPIIIITVFTTGISMAQKHTPLPHGMVFGQQVDPRQSLPAEKVEGFMGNKTRILTTITGVVLKIDMPKGGWFSMDAGNGKVIKVHFKDYNIYLPTDLRGRHVMIQGVAQKAFIADDMQHFAGDTVKGKKQHTVKTSPKERLTFEATGLYVE